MSEIHLDLKKVHRHYGEGAKMVRVLEAADLTVLSGEMVALVAPSGAGKSTLLHISGLLERPQQGEVEIIGTPTVGLSDKARTLLRRTTVGYVYQFHHLLPEFTALENISIPQMIAGKSQKEADMRSHFLLDVLGVDVRAAHRPAELSGGEQSAGDSGRRAHRQSRPRHQRTGVRGLARIDPGGRRRGAYRHPQLRSRPSRRSRSDDP
jgi:lipoprotein-releasing system ATP-binding protein